MCPPHPPHPQHQTVRPMLEGVLAAHTAVRLVGVCGLCGLTDRDKDLDLPSEFDELEDLVISRLTCSLVSTRLIGGDPTIGALLERS